MVFKVSAPRQDVYADLTEDAKAFYSECAAVYKRPALQVLAELDPPDPEQDGALVSYYEQKLRGELQYPLENPVRADAISKWAAGRATLQRYLKAAAGSDQLLQIKDFFTRPDVTSLFPAYVEGRIQQGLLQSSLVGELVLADEAADSTTVAATYATDSAADRSLRRIAEGQELPASEIGVSASTISLSKYGRQLRWSYESANGQRVDLIGNMLSKVGRQVGIDETDALLHVAVAGDGTPMGAAETNDTDVDVASAGSIAFSDLLAWYYNVPSSAYKLDKAVAGKTDLRLIADLTEFSDVEYLQNQSSLRIPTPAAMSYYWWDGGVAGSSYANRLVIGFDSRQAIVAYTYGGFIQEADKLIDRQMHRVSFAYWRGFRKFDAGAVQVLDVDNAL